MTLKNILLLVLLSIFILPSCSTDEHNLGGIDDPIDEIQEEEETGCTIDDYTLILKPNCSWDPDNDHTKATPIMITFDNTYPADPSKYQFDWHTATNTNLGESWATVITYPDLPVSVTVTDLDTGCTAELSIDASYWP